MQEMQVRSLGREDPLEKEMATYSSILAWEIPWAEESIGSQKELEATAKQQQQRKIIRKLNKKMYV